MQSSNIVRACICHGCKSYLWTK